MHFSLNNTPVNYVCDNKCSKLNFHNKYRKNIHLYNSVGHLRVSKQLVGNMYCRANIISGKYNVEQLRCQAFECWVNIPDPKNIIY